MVDVYSIIDDLKTLENLINSVTPSAAPLNNLTATSNPGITDDSSVGYSTSSIWFNTITQVFWACTSAAPGAAVWIAQTSGGVLNNMTATTAPTVNDDTSIGYSVDSGWFDTVTGLLYYCQDPADGAAVWVQVPTTTDTSPVFAGNIWVSTNGNNLTAAVNQMARPYSTIAAARLAAIAAGGTWVINVMGGTYAEAGTITLTNNIHYRFHGKGSLSSTAGSSLFTGVSGATVFIDADGWDLNGLSSRNVFTTSVASTVFIRANNITSVGSPAIYSSHASAITNVWANNRITSAANGWGTIVTDSGGGTYNVTADLIENTANGGKGIELEGGTVSFKGRRCVGTHATSASIKINNSGGSDKMYFEFDELLSGNGWTFWAEGASPYIYLNASRVDGAGTCTLVSSGSTQAYYRGSHLVNRNAATYGLIHSENTSILTAEGWVLERNGGATGDDLDTEAGATIRLIGVDYDPSLVDNDGQILCITHVPQYSAALTQDSTPSPPTEVLNTDTTHASITYEYVGVGQYSINSDIAIFKIGKYRAWLDYIVAAGSEFYTITRSDDNTLILTTYGASAPQDGILQGNNLVIEIYP